jgi:hypothetical protein
MLLTTKQRDVLLFYNDELMTYMEVMMRPDSEKWLGAVKSEIRHGVRPINCKWVFQKKTDKDVIVQIYKARLVVKGCKQIHGIDYCETFSPA